MQTPPPLTPTAAVAPVKVATSEGWLPAVTNVGPVKPLTAGRLTFTVTLVLALAPAWLVVESVNVVSVCSAAVVSACAELVPGEVSAVAVAGLIVPVQPLQTVAESVVVSPGLIGFVPVMESSDVVGRAAAVTCSVATAVLFAFTPSVTVSV